MAEQIVIVKNNGAVSVDIEDLGLSVPATGSLNLTSQYYLKDILTSKSLYTLVNNDILIINDGTSDLNKATALDYITIEVMGSGGSLGVNFEIIQLWNTTAQNVNGSSPTRIKWDGVLYYDTNNYSLNSNTGTVTVLTSGMYEVYYHLNLDFTGNQCVVETYDLFSGTVFTRSSGFRGSYRRSKEMVTNKSLKELNVNETIEVYGVRNASSYTSDVNTIVQKCFLSVIKLRNL